MHQVGLFQPWWPRLGVAFVMVEEVVRKDSPSVRLDCFAWRNARNDNRKNACCHGFLRKVAHFAGSVSSQGFFSKLLGFAVIELVQDGFEARNAA